MPPSPPVGTVFSGDYASWDDAVRAGGTYDTDEIFEKTAKATLAVVRGEALYERDSMVFHQHDPLFPWPLLAHLLWIASQQNGELRVVDFGGAIGSTYLQCKPYLGNLKRVRWTVIDQSKQVAFGTQNLQDSVLDFAHSIEDIHDCTSGATLIASGVLHCLPTPMQTLDNLLAKQFEYVLIDRVPLVEFQRDRLTIQHVPPSIYEATYPAWFLKRDDFLSRFQQNYIAKAEWLSGDRYLLDDDLFLPQGLFFLKQSNPTLGE
jgi:putative methyltransferase (TIGR04325 family)